MKFKLIFIILSCFGLYAFAQQDFLSPIQNSWEVIGNNFEFNYNNSDYCDYFLVSTRDREMRLSPGKNTLYRVPKERYNRTDPEFLPSSYKVYKGYFPEKLHPGFLYSLPVKNGDSVVYKVNTKRRTLNYLFMIENLDTVYAVRSGVVCKNMDQGLSESKGNFGGVGNLLVYHLDRTFAQYGLMSKILVTPGQNITVGQAIGVASIKQYVSISFFYLDRNKFVGVNPSGFPHTYFNPVFHTTEGDLKIEEGKNYICEWAPEVITQEMTKKEKKKYDKKNRLNADK